MYLKNIKYKTQHNNTKYMNLRKNILFASSCFRGNRPDQRSAETKEF